MSENEIRAEVARAFEETLLIEYALLAKRHRTQEILLEVAKEYFVTCTFSKKPVPRVIFFKNVAELKSVPDDPLWHDIEKRSYKDRIRIAQSGYKESPSSKREVEDQLLLAESSDLDSVHILIERLKQYASISKNKPKLIGLINQLNQLF